MVRPPPVVGEKPVHWMGSSKLDLLAFPTQVVSDVGYALGIAQLGGKHPAAKPWKGEGAGVFDVVESYDGNAYRAIYTVRLEGAVYVLHAFQKKSPSGIRTAQRDIDLVKDRLRRAQEHHQQQQKSAPQGQGRQT